MAEEELRAQIFLVVEAGEGARERLAATLGAGAASVLIMPSAGRPLAGPAVSPLIEQAQAAGAAALVYGDAALARQLKADGVHMAQSNGDDLVEHYELARKTVGPQAIVGVPIGHSRHTAMTVGEAGADYIAFGLPTDLPDIAAARARRLELIGWWAQIFEVPCVALDVDTPAEARELAQAGADFIGVTLTNGQSPAQAADRVRAIAEVLSAVDTV